MKINNSISYPSFKANFYKVKTNQTGYVLYQTDNEKKLGNEPVLCIQTKHGDNSVCKPLKKDDRGLFTAQNVLNADSTFHIKYKDTQNIDGPFYIPHDLIRKTTIYDKKAHNQPLVHYISKNETNGKLLIIDDNNKNKKIDNPNQPTIILCRKSEDFNYYSYFNKSPAGVIFVDTEMSDLSHEAASLRNATPFAVGLWDEDKIQELKQYENKFIKLTPQDNNLEIKEITESEIKPILKTKKKITLPQMKPIDKLLDSNEYTKDNVGNKAYNLKRLEEMATQGKINVTIPKSFAIPFQYIGAMLEENPNSSIRLDEIKTKVKENDFGEIFMVRSAFNGEDLEDYAAQGLYDSTLTRERFLYDSIVEVVNSKDSERAKKSRIEHNINPKDIQPTVLIQEMINADYKFTIYTKYKNNELLIELTPRSNPFRESLPEPYIIKYNADKDTLNIESIARRGRYITLDENYNIVDEDKIDDDISENYEKYEPILKEVAKNALAVEKEFGRPQDIEGGILGDKIYFWQTRNIVS